MSECEDGNFTSPTKYEILVVKPKRNVTLFLNVYMVFCSLIFTITTLIKWHDHAQTKAIHKAVMLNE